MLNITAIIIPIKWFCHFLALGQVTDSASSDINRKDNSLFHKAIVKLNYIIYVK